VHLKIVFALKAGDYKLELHYRYGFTGNEAIVAILNIVDSL
jgi:hypothetical protein